MQKFFIALAAFLIFSTVLAFSDIGPKNSHKVAIDYLQKHGIVAGFADGEFKANQSITRAELAKILVKVRGIQTDTKRFRNCFPDVGAEWFAVFVCQAKHQEWIAGYPNSTFQPANFLNRAEAVKIILTALGVGLDDFSQFPDVVSTDWFAIFAATTHSQNLLDVTKFQANRAITRGEVAETIFRILVTKDSGADVFDANLLANFNLIKSPSEILAGSLDFPYTDFTNLGITNWEVKNGIWTLQPTLEFAEKKYQFATPQNYVAALQKIQTHF
ncbi:S-layer homology domain-containing protein [Candidatus Gracilibacteria bacterium]|nr:S-layer homology domain-containing protein [Candidatus Gracilibacteria bacterium]MCF7856671.1 S-layer homology domain-containing protein [Candidatus Gracilibacteria bacterium]MCF7897002.1 S-layer homology domain-containing protein [Candidatus Gracilibacteria bacterium]